MKRGKKLGLVRILALIKEGLSPAQISKKYDIPKQTLSYSVGKLKALGCIEKKGYGTWEFKKDLKEVPKRPRGTKAGQIRTSSKKEIRGHAFIWKINFYDYNYNWPRIIRNYKKKKLTFRFILNKKVIRTIFKGRKIWLTRSGIIIYEPLDFVGKSSFQVKGNAVFEMDRLIKDLLEELKLTLRRYRFTTSREHYGMIRNELARQYNERKEKLYIKSEEGTTWLWIDDSESLAELETNDPSISRQVQNFYNDHKKTKFEVTPSFVLDSLNKTNAAVQQNTANLDYHAENMKSHVGATKDLSAASNSLKEEVKRIADILAKLDRKLK